MKTKFIKVWDDLRFGYLNFIVLQVEETDKFLIQSGLNVGYKIIVQAYPKYVGAAGGNNFNPYYNKRVRNISKILDSTEADVLGFYLNNINDIYEIPEELYTEEFWNVVRTDSYSQDKDEIDFENCYKCLITYDNLTGRKRVDLAFINKNSLIQELRYLSDSHRSIENYLWSQCETLPIDLWEDVKDKNDEYFIYRIYDLEEDDYI
jgi:hypothetical protein